MWKEKDKEKERETERERCCNAKAGASVGLDPEHAALQKCSSCGLGAGACCGAKSSSCRIGSGAINPPMIRSGCMKQARLLLKKGRQPGLASPPKAAPGLSRSEVRAWLHCCHSRCSASSMIAGRLREAAKFLSGTCSDKAEMSSRKPRPGGNAAMIS